MLPLTKTLDPADFDQLTEELQIVDQSFTRAAPQHAARRWEYALALRALDTWLTDRHRPTAGTIVDVGGAGSPFHYMLGDAAIVVDPAEADGQALAEYLDTAPRLAQAVFCLSVIEHVEDLDRFLYHLSCLVAPGGLLVLTMDYGDMYGAHPLSNQDPFHFHWMRQRIFTESTWTELAMTFQALQFAGFGGTDWTYHGPTVYDYTFASLTLIKRP